MPIYYYVYGPYSLVIAGISNLLNLGYTIQCQNCSTEPADDEQIYNIIELIRIIKQKHNLKDDSRVILKVLE